MCRSRVLLFGFGVSSVSCRASPLPSALVVARHCGSGQWFCIDIFCSEPTVRPRALCKASPIRLSRQSDQGRVVLQDRASQAGYEVCTVWRLVIHRMTLTGKQADGHAIRGEDDSSSVRCARVSGWQACMHPNGSQRAGGRQRRDETRRGGVKPVVRQTRRVCHKGTGTRRVCASFRNKNNFPSFAV